MKEIKEMDMPKLGFGMMRLPKDEAGNIDLEKTNEMVDTYMAAGMNYFDTAYAYPGSEAAIKETLVKRYLRESFYLADKLPAWNLETKEDRDRVFQESLERTGAGYFDFYLLHSIEEGDHYDTYADLDCFEWAKRKKEEGKIRHFGFSFHGTPELLETILSEHPEVEFVQIQLNYLDWDNPLVQSGRLYDILQKYGKPMIIMEPVKGGRLANLEEELTEEMRAVRPDKSVASWAMRFAASLEGVTTILSGMSTQEQMEDNLKTFSNFEPLTEKEEAVLQTVTAKLQDKPLIQCTACSYCVPGCPAQIKIPDVFKALNTRACIQMTAGRNCSMPISPTGIPARRKRASSAANVKVSAPSTFPSLST